MILRVVQHQITERLTIYPAVALVGLRQCGKTTLAQSIGGAYFDLEQQSDRLRPDKTAAKREFFVGSVVLEAFSAIRPSTKYSNQ